MASSGFSDRNRLEGVAVGEYQVIIRDRNACTDTLLIPVREFDVQLDEARSLIRPPSCHGYSDGIIALAVDRGQLPYLFDWNDGNGPLGQARKEGLGAGSYSVDIIDAGGCRGRFNMVLEGPPPLESQVDVMDASCYGAQDGLAEALVTGGTPRYDFRWSTGASDSLLRQLFAGAYTLQIEDANGCQLEQVVDIGEPPALRVDAGQDREIDLGMQVALSGSSNDPFASLSWSPGEGLSCIDCPTPMASPAGPTTYRLQALDRYGCMALDSVRVDLSSNLPVYFPNAFSPNGDGNNDYFSVFGGPALRQVRSLHIFDRWGTLLFEKENLPANDPSAGWDGRSRSREMDTGLYVYLVELEFIDGSILDYSGEVMLVR